MIVYWSAWLRVHYTAEYFCGLLRNAPLGTYPAHVLEAEARRCGIRFLPFDVQRSPALPAIERVRGGLAIRHGLGYVKGLGSEAADAIVAERARGPFETLADFVDRLRLDRRAVENLVLAGAFDGLGERRGLLWDLAAAFELVKRPPGRALPFDVPDERPALRPMSTTQKTILTFAATGVTGDLHLVELRRDAFTRAGCLTLPELRRMRPGARVRVGGLVADGLRRPPTAKGTAFIRLEQPDGLIDVIVPAEVYAACRPALRFALPGHRRRAAARAAGAQPRGPQRARGVSLSRANRLRRYPAISGHSGNSSDIPLCIHEIIKRQSILPT